MAMLGEQRMDGLSRLLVGGLYLLLFMFIIAPVLFTVAVILGAIDVLWQLLTNRDGIMSSNLFTDVWETQLHNVRWALFGTGDFKLAIF
jgi:hypothetical protein